MELMTVITTGSGSDWEDGDEKGMFRSSCVANLKQMLQKRKGMTAAAAKEFISKRVTIDVKEASYDDEGVRTLKVSSEIRAASKAAGSDVPSMSLEYEYHHRCRMSSLEHLCKLTYSMPGASGNLFKTSMANLPGRGENQIERRSFTFAQKKTKMLRDSVFGEGWSPLEAILMCYAAAGVAYADSNACLESPADTPVCKSDWLEHHTKKVCKALDEDDDGYETEPFSKRYQAELEEIRANGPGSDDEGYGRGGFGFW